MEKLRNRQTKHGKLLAVITILLVTLFSGHALQTILNAPERALFVAGGIGVVYLLMRPDFLKLDARKLAFLLFALMIVLTIITTMDAGNLWFYMVLLCTIIVAFVVTEMFSFESVVNCYVNVMTFVAAVGLVGHILLLNTSLLNALPVMESFNDFEYGVGIIFNYIVTMPERNCGMFWEPGLFATHLTIAMVFEILRSVRVSIWRIALFSACLFTANSSAGFVLWFLCMLLLLVKGQKRETGIIQGIVYCVLLGLAVVFVLNFDKVLSMTSLGDNEYFQKLSSDSLLDSSRFNAVNHNLSIFATAPLFGAGITTVTQNMAYVADTSTSTYLLSIFGLPAIGYTLFWIKGIFNLKRFNVFSRLLLLVIALLILNKEPHHTLLFSWCVLFYLLKKPSSSECSLADDGRNVA